MCLCIALICPSHFSLGDGDQEEEEGEEGTYINVRALVQSQAAGLAVHKEHFYDRMWPIDAEARQLSH